MKRPDDMLGSLGEPSSGCSTTAQLVGVPGRWAWALVLVGDLVVGAAAGPTG